MANVYEEHEEEDEDHELGVHLVSFRWEELGPFVLIFTFVVLSGLAKIIFHHFHVLSSRVPESCLLVLVGVGFGALIEFGGLTMLPPFTTEFFFHFLLPPIILEAAYSLHHKAFLDNIRTILLFAIVGTLFNFLLIGGLLVGTNQLGFMESSGTIRISVNETSYHNMTSVEIFTFASLISAVDPVAVLAIFAEVGVNSELYYIVFGESLLNDGVAVVFYSMMNSFAELDAAGLPITLEQCLLGCASFITIAFGGLAIGILIGLLTGLVTRTTSEVSVIEPLIVIGMAFTAYYLAEMFHWSGIISLIGCGIVQAHYSFKNIQGNSHITIEYFSKMLSSTMDSVIFLYLGKALWGREESWSWNIHTGFLCWTLVFCLVVRFIGVYFFTFFLNRFRIKPINLQEQFIMAYGGLRGAVGFSLVISIQRNIVPSADMLVSTTLIVVMFTIWLQGGTIKPLVNILNIDKEAKEHKSLMEELNDSMMEQMITGINQVTGRHGYIYFQTKFFKFDEEVMMKIFCNPDQDHDMKKLFEEIVLADHLENVYDPKKTIKKTLEFINQGYEASEPSTVLDVVVEKGTSNNFLQPIGRKDSIRSGISSVSRLSQMRPQWGASTYGHAVLRPGGGQEEKDAKKLLRKGLLNQHSNLFDQQDIDERNRLSVRNFPRRRSSTVSGVSGFQNQLRGRERTISTNSNFSRTSLKTFE